MTRSIRAQELKNAELVEARALLERAVELLDDIPTSSDPSFWRDYYTFTGDHMICTEEGWQPGEVKKDLVAEYGADAILAEVNPPA